MKQLAFIAASCLLLLSCGQGSSKDAEGKADSKAPGGEQGTSKSSSEVKILPESQQKAGLQYAAVRGRAIRDGFTAAGQIVWNEDQTAHVGTYADGRVVELNATIGSSVRKGAVLARLHSHAVHETRAALQSAGEEVRRQRQVIEFRQRMRDRMGRLVALKSASPQELERAEADLHNAQTDLQNAQFNQQKETAHFADILRIPEAEAAKIDERLELAPILAPISGVVVDRKVTLGTIVEPGAETFTISNLSSVWMMASINEPDISKVHVGSTAKVKCQAYAEELFGGRVSCIAPQLDPQTRTLQARILLPNREGKLHPGMFANAEIAGGKPRQGIFLPERAIQDLNGAPVVFIRKTDDNFEVRPVQVANRINGEAEIAAGVKEGEAVVTEGSFVVKSELLKSQIGQ